MTLAQLCQETPLKEVQIFYKIYFQGLTAPYCCYAGPRIPGWVENKMRIFYFDFTSLYPSVNYDGLYPMGHPEPKTWHANVHWTSSADIIDPCTGEKLKGFLKI